VSTGKSWEFHENVVLFPWGDQRRKIPAAIPDDADLKTKNPAFFRVGLTETRPVDGPSS
jgi:hypothetical protein